MKIKTDKNQKIWRALLFSLVFLLGASCGAFLIFKNYGRLSPSPAVNSATQNVYVAFVDEVYGKIKEKRSARQIFWFLSVLIFISAFV